MSLLANSSTVKTLVRRSANHDPLITIFFFDPLLSSNFSLYLNDDNNSEQYNDSNSDSKTVSLSFLIVFHKAIFGNYVIILRSKF